MAVQLASGVTFRDERAALIYYDGTPSEQEFIYRRRIPCLPVPKAYLFCPHPTPSQFWHDFHLTYRELKSVNTCQIYQVDSYLSVHMDGEELKCF